MESLIFSLNVTMPVVLTIVFGYYLGRKRVVTPVFCDSASKLMFDYAYPMSLFYSLASTPFEEHPSLSLLLFAVLSQIAAFLAALLIVPRFVPDKSKSHTMIQGMIRTNFLMQGLPVALNMYGVRGSAPAFLILPFGISVNTVVSQTLFAMEHDDGQRISIAASICKTAVKTLKAPLVISCVAGVTASLLPVKLPSVVMSVFETVGKVPGPLALLMLGAQFELNSFKGNLKYALPSAVVRVAVVPFFMTVGAILLGFRGNTLGCLFALNASATATISFIIAKTMGGDADIAGQIVGMTTVLSSFTVFLGIFILRQLGLI